VRILRGDFDFGTCSRSSHSCSERRSGGSGRIDYALPHSSISLIRLFSAAFSRMMQKIVLQRATIYFPCAVLPFTVLRELLHRPRVRPHIENEAALDTTRTKLIARRRSRCVRALRAGVRTKSKAKAATTLASLY
jgi:hypothetical protein